MIARLRQPNSVGRVAEVEQRLDFPLRQRLDHLLLHFHIRDARERAPWRSRPSGCTRRRRRAFPGSGGAGCPRETPRSAITCEEGVDVGWAEGSATRWGRPPLQRRSRGSMPRVSAYASTVRRALPLHIAGSQVGRDRLFQAHAVVRCRGIISADQDHPSFRPRPWTLWRSDEVKQNPGAEPLQIICSRPSDWGRISPRS